VGFLEIILSKKIKKNQKYEFKENWGTLWIPFEKPFMSGIS